MSNLYTQKISRPGLGEIDATAKQAAGRRSDPGHWAGKLASMKPNLRRLLKAGVTDREFRELLFQTLHYAGWSVGGPAMRNYKEVLAEKGD